MKTLWHQLEGFGIFTKEEAEGNQENNKFKLICLSPTEVKSPFSPHKVLYSFEVGKIYNGELYNSNSWRVYVDDLNNYVYSRRDRGYFMDLNEYRSSQIQKLGI